MTTTHVIPTMTRRQLAVLAVIGTLLLAAVVSLLFGPARGAREDIAGVREDLRGDLRTVVDGVQAGVTLARSTLAVAGSTLDTGLAALSVARTTLETLRQSRDLQVSLLDVARQTLRQATEINRKIPFPPVFPTGTR